VVSTPNNGREETSATRSLALDPSAQMYRHARPLRFCRTDEAGYVLSRTCGEGKGANARGRSIAGHAGSGHNGWDQFGKRREYRLAGSLDADRKKKIREKKNYTSCTELSCTSHVHHGSGGDASCIVLAERRVRGVISRLQWHKGLTALDVEEDRDGMFWRTEGKRAGCHWRCRRFDSPTDEAGVFPQRGKLVLRFCLINSKSEEVLPRGALHAHYWLTKYICALRIARKGSTGRPLRVRKACF